ncbi:hypothetical protein GQX73_g6639 [Xylaria multiplex]|uniref:Uncharacterized protein n=1 Tax=Xylaria multiplex TaxID=323545 RepID=A0A7C8MMY9_9PEZI|nr:hypothetical protein GQX73_g6639 [Xylaria multiplex]
MEGEYDSRADDDDYEKLLRTIEESKDRDSEAVFSSKLRFEYTRSHKFVEIRTTNVLHEEVANGIMGKISSWMQGLRSSTDYTISRAARTIESSDNVGVKFPFTEGMPDQRSPERSLGHACLQIPQCVYPTWIMEVRWGGHWVLYSDQEADDYIHRSKGAIRTIVVICLQGVHKAEYANERRLYNMHLAGQVNPDESYAKDKRNETGEATFKVWQAKLRPNGEWVARLVQTQKFRDSEGRAVESVSLDISLNDFLCRHIAGPELGRSLKISSEDLCKLVDKSLEYYRLEREVIIKRLAEEKMTQKISEGTTVPSESSLSDGDEIIAYLDEGSKRMFYAVLKSKDVTEEWSVIDPNGGREDEGDVLWELH